MPKKEYKYTPEEYRAIKGLKKAIIEAFTINDSPGVYRDVLQLIQDASELFEDFRKDIASKALRYKNISDKQAYCLAAGLIEEGMADYNQYMHYADDDER